MKKFLLSVAAVMLVTALSAPMAFAAPMLSPTEPDPPSTELMDPDTPLGDMEMSDPDVPLEEVEMSDPDVPLGDLGLDDPDVPLSDELLDIDDPDVPLAFVPAPQTGVTGLSGMEALALAAALCAVSGGVLLVKARKQTGSVR